jgi:hypothetical protein
MTQEKSRLSKITEVALDATRRFISKNPETIVDIKEKNEEWAVTVEVMQRKAVPDTQDLLGRYLIRINKDGELIGWTQKCIRKRSDLISSSEAAE